MALPLVSVVAVCQNHERFVLQTLDSIKNQTFNDIELFIIDNNSNDNSVRIIEEWIQDNPLMNVKFNPLNVRQGLCKILNDSLRQLNGKYYQLISCDDALDINKLERHVEIFKNLDETYAVVFSEAYLINSNSEIYYSHFISGLKQRLFKVPEGDIYEYLLEKGNFIPALTCLMKTDVIRSVGGYDENVIYEDYDMWLNLSRKYLFKFDEVSTSYYRIHESNFDRKIDYKFENFRIFIKHCKSSPRLVKTNLRTILFHLYKKRHPKTLECYEMYKAEFEAIPLYEMCYRLHLTFRVFISLNSRLTKNEI